MTRIGDAVKPIRKKDTKRWDNALNYFIQQLNNDNIDLKIKAIINLGDMGDPRAIEPLEQIMNDNDEKIRTHAKHAILRIKKKLMQSPNKAVL